MIKEEQLSELAKDLRDNSFKSQLDKSRRMQRYISFEALKEICEYHEEHMEKLKDKIEVIEKFDKQEIEK